MRRTIIVHAAVVATLLLTARPAITDAQVVRTEAFIGTSLGVGLIEVRVPNGQVPARTGLRGIEIRERDGRVSYPAIEVREVPGVVKNVFSGARRPIGQMIGSLLEAQPPTVLYYFLFEGDGPLQTTLMTNTPRHATIVPRRDPDGFRRLVALWWQHYTAPPGLLQPKDDYPPLVDNYMQCMLAQRFDLKRPAPPAGAPASRWQNAFSQQFGLALDQQPFILGMQRARFMEPETYQEEATEPVPAPLALCAAPPDAVASSGMNNIDIEPLAMFVPQDCFYVRFGSFNNFLWFQDTLATWGGDLQNLVALRGLDYQTSQRIEQQLALKQSALARLFGQSIIADVALVGNDAFFQDGASFGLLFHAKNNLLLTTDFMRQRKERADEAPGSTFETILINGRRVSYLETPDGRTRSFYASVGEFHLVTRCETLARDFLGLDTKVDSLGALDEFRQARSRLPLDRGDTIFAYFSRPFFLNASSPEYRIRTVRRMQALADIQLVELARLAARGDGRPCESIEQLVEGRYLPPTFGPRPEGSRTLLEAGEVRDSLWGRPGQMLPVADAPIERVTPSEAADYRHFRAYFQEHWGTLDPMVAAIRHEDLGQRRIRVTIDLRMTPLSVENYRRAERLLGPPSDRRLVAVDDDIAAFELLLRDAHWFGGLRDVRLPAPVNAERSGPAEALARGLAPGRVFRESLVGYLGAVDGKLGWMRLLDVGFPPPGPGGGLVTSPLGGLRLVQTPFTLYSFQRDVLLAAAPQLRFQETEHASQCWIRVGDVSSARVTPSLNNLLYARTRETSRGNLRLMQSLREQLKVAPDECKETAETLLGARLICPLKGTYQYDPQRRQWNSSALNEAFDDGDPLKTIAPPGFIAPPLNWLRGLDAQLRFDTSAIEAHAVIEMEQPK